VLDAIQKAMVLGLQKQVAIQKVEQQPALASSPRMPQQLHTFSACCKVIQTNL
jgi:hypothetical protein